MIYGRCYNILCIFQIDWAERLWREFNRKIFCHNTFHFFGDIILTIHALSKVIRHHIEIDHIGPIIFFYLGNKIGETNLLQKITTHSNINTSLWKIATNIDETGQLKFTGVLLL